MRRFARVPGVSVENVGHLWAAFSPANGETTLLNDESAAILELLEIGPADTSSICASLAADSGLAAESLTDLVSESWPKLLEAGLVRESGNSFSAPDQ